ncbi:LysM peptidoglycan-binding domain-containing protein [Streptomyces pinistramenti]|uniref:LysM peptidoglycan-binding domain-containing protein n=1 Tax=Streptomyces pinistramenti TaxID=2884812 RepID=UPI001D07DAB1|nr:transglycosylase family protein [Streptomyces pinistramenti]MCB5908623.1 LysM peptidoglycan-binding domain-containing protein [Streptomyces pinistramenti]
MSSPLAKRSVETILSVLLVLLSALGIGGRSAAAAAPHTAPAAQPSTAPAGTDWDRIAHCESGGRWNTNTGNGFHGGLQIAPSTWRAYGGKRYAPRADLASKSQQIAVGERIARDRGLAPWPNCGRLGATGAEENGVSSATHEPPAAQHTPAPHVHKHHVHKHHVHKHHQSTAPRTSGGTVHRQTGGRITGKSYVVQPGDCLSVIAQRADISGGTQALYELNKKSLHEGPDHIYPGQHLVLRA